MHLLKTEGVSFQNVLIFFSKYLQITSMELFLTKNECQVWLQVSFNNFTQISYWITFNLKCVFKISDWITWSDFNKFTKSPKTLNSIHPIISINIYTWLPRNLYVHWIVFCWFGRILCFCLYLYTYGKCFFIGFKIVFFFLLKLGTASW